MASVSQSPSVVSSVKEVLKSLTVHHLDKLNPTWRELSEAFFDHPEAHAISFPSTTLGSEMNDVSVQSRLDKKEECLDTPLMQMYYNMVVLPGCAKVFYKGEWIGAYRIPLFQLEHGSIEIKSEEPFTAYCLTNEVREQLLHNLYVEEGGVIYSFGQVYKLM